MKINKKLVFLIIVSIIGNIIIYPFIPEKIPHKNFHMEVDGYSGKWTLFLMPLTTVGMYFLLFFLGKLDKKNELNIKTYDLIVTLSVLFFILLNVWFMFYSLDYHINIIRLLNVAMGTILIILGNYLPRVKINSVFGIRTPWTLRNEQVWKNTHRFGGYVLVAAGIISFIFAFFRSFIGIIGLISVSAMTVLITCIFSYINYTKQGMHS